MSINKSQKNYIHEQASALFGHPVQRMGKTKARQNFLPMIDKLSKHSQTVEITDRQTPVAVILAYEHYAYLISQLSKLTQAVPKKKDTMIGSVIIHGDLESGSKAIAKDFEDAIRRSAAKL